MFGAGKTYFANSPVVIDISGLYWGETVTSPFTIVRMEVVRVDGQGNPVNTIGEFKADTGGQTSISFDISSALRAMWTTEQFATELSDAQSAADSAGETGFCTQLRAYIPYALRIYTEYLDSTDGEYTSTQCSVEIAGVEYTLIPGGQCLIGGYTEWERSLITEPTKRDVSALEHTNPRNGDASTKPTSSPERVGEDSITSWTDVQTAGTKTIFYPTGAEPEDDDPDNRGQSAWQGHAPIVLRDSQPYVDFLFVNRRGAVETCSAVMLEAMDINVETKQYTRVEGPTFRPVRSLMAIPSGGRRTWAMSSGYQTRDWTEWWTMEFLMGRRWWMRYPVGDANGTYVPVTVKPAKNPSAIYDRSKQQMPHVDFTVTLALEG